MFYIFDTHHVAAIVLPLLKMFHTLNTVPSKIGCRINLTVLVGMNFEAKW